jgi:hypothetical protein
VNEDVIVEKYTKLKEHFAEINLLQRVVNNAFKREFDILKEYEKNNDPASIISHDAFIFDNPFSGKLEKYAVRKTSLEALTKMTVWHKNNQYCWLVVNAYEKFEQFIRFAYEHLTQNKEIYFNKILYHFSNNYEHIKKKEKNNHFNVHLKVAVLMVEKLRHKIVHAQGVIENAEEFTEEIIKCSGVNNNKNEHKLFINQFIIENKVFLLEEPILDNGNLQRHYDVYRHIVSYMFAYACLVVEATAKHE